VSKRRLRVTHETRYVYTGRIEQAYHVAYLKPRSGVLQQLDDFTLHIEPAPVVIDSSADGYGNHRVHFNLDVPHEELLVRAESTLSVNAPAFPRHGGPRWEQVRDALSYHAGATFDAASEFVFASEYVPRHGELAAYAATSFTPGRPIVEAAWHLSERIHAEFAYTPQSTQVNTPALDALRGRRGVCQDFAHVMIGALRSIGLAARYVSGYLMTRPPPGKARLVGADASHAWVSVYLGKGFGENAWLELCPTNNRAPGDDYVTLAYGRDYADIAPLRGVIHGSGEHQLTVAVTVEEI
jgi:transglutaminase-like putative cysteine protease